MAESFADKLRKMAEEASADDGMKIYEKIKKQCEDDARLGFRSTMVSVPSIFTKFITFKLHDDGFKTNINYCNDFNDTFYISWK